jgi:hypothetical protein
MPILMSTWILSIASAVVAQCGAFLAWTPESGVLALWGGVLLFSAQRIRHHRERSRLHSAQARDVRHVATPGASPLNPRNSGSWGPGVAVAPR